MTGPAFHLQLLGRPRLQRDGAALPVTMRKSWALLVLLALAGAQPRRRVVDSLWPALDEPSGRRNLRRELARLNEAGAAGLVVAQGDVLQLALETAVDVPLFEQAAAAGRHDDALSLWNGTLAEDLSLDEAEGFERWLGGERERLRARWRDALEALALASAPVQAEGHWRALLADDPLQERHHGALIALLVAAGRREAAQAQYERCRTLLADELGLAPLAQTQALLVDAAPTPAAVAERPAAPNLPGALPFVGRHAEVAALEAAWARAAWVLVQGEGGVGKTRLVSDFCAAHGAWAVARCQSGDRDVPYAAFVRALRTLGGGNLPAATPGWVNDELARVLPELGRAPRPLASDEERARFFEACANAWSALAGESFDAIVIDDVQHADEPSLQLLRWLLQRAAAGTRCFLLARPAPQLVPLAEAAGLHLMLAPLPSEPVLELVQRLSGSVAGQRFAARLQAATGGNPFFIAETLRHLVEAGQLQADAQGRWRTPYDEATQDYRELPLPASVREAVLGRVQRLPEPARRLLQAASVAAEPLAPRLLGAACALSELEATDAIEHALDAALLRQNDRGDIVFGHELTQQALAGALTPQRARLLHRRLALAAESTGERPAVIAAHFEQAGDGARALPHRLAAGDEAAALFAPGAALVHWQAALALGPSPEQLAGVLPRMARAHIDLGDAEGNEARLAEFDALLAGPSLSAAARGEAVLACAEIECSLNVSDRALRRLDALLPGLPPGPLRTRAMRVHCNALQSLGRLEEAQASGEAALQALGDTDPLERARLLDSLQLVMYQRGRPADALQLARQAAALWEAHGDPRERQRGHYRLGVLMIVTDQVEAGERELERALAMAEEMHLIEAQRECMINLMKAQADRGDGEQMLAMAERAWNLSPTFPRRRLRQILLQARLFANSQLGRMGAALTLAEQVLQEAEGSAEPVARQYAVVAMLDLVVYFDDFERGRELLDSLQGAGELSYLGVKLAMNRAHLEVRAGCLAEARAALAEVGDPGVLQQPQDLATWAQRNAELRLAEGFAAEALALLEPWREGMPNVELLAQSWALRLRAWAAQGQRASAAAAHDWQQALHALQTGQVPPMDAWDLRCALLQTAPEPAAVAALRAETEAVTQALADGLVDWPAYRTRFLERARGALQTEGRSSP